MGQHLLELVQIFLVLENKAMNINLFINDASSDLAILNLCKQSKKINFISQKLNKFNLLKNEKNLIVLNEDLSLDGFTKQMKKNFITDSSNLCVLLKTNSKMNNFFVNAKKINYPIKFTDFENQILKAFEVIKYLFNNLELRLNSILCNLNNNKKTHLTEIESGIIKFLFTKKIVDKKTLSLNVLKHSSLIDSKSLDSHLYRLRKKLYLIDKNTKIVSTNNKKIKII